MMITKWCSVVFNVDEVHFVRNPQRLMIVTLMGVFIWGENMKR